MANLSQKSQDSITAIQQIAVPAAQVLSYTVAYPDISAVQINAIVDNLQNANLAVVLTLTDSAGNESAARVTVWSGDDYANNINWTKADVVAALQTMFNIPILEKLGAGTVAAPAP